MKSAYLDKKTYLRNLYGIASLLAGLSFIILEKLNFVLIFIGIFFILEHIWNFTKFELLDFTGHEWLGVYLLTLGICFTPMSAPLLIGIIFILLGIGLNLDTGLHTMKPFMRKIFKIKL